MKRWDFHTKERRRRRFGIEKKTEELLLPFSPSCEIS
jgi:hypothetical protein